MKEFTITNGVTVCKYYLSSNICYDDNYRIIRFVKELFINRCNDSQFNFECFYNFFKKIYESEFENNLENDPQFNHFIKKYNIAY